MTGKRYAERTAKHFPVDTLAMEELKPVFYRLKDIGYSENSVNNRLGIEDITGILYKNLPVYLSFRLMENSRLDRVIKLFLLSQPISEADALDCFGEDVLNRMLRANLVTREKSAISAPVDLHPVEEFYLATDHFITTSTSIDRVYPLMGDSYTLVRCMMTEPVSSALDLCTGSGIQAIVASKYAERVIGVDINPRAVNFARFNALLNQRPNVEFRQGDLYDAVKGMKFDRVLANPPFAPAPKVTLYYRDGGETGESVLQRIVAGLPEHLSEKGSSQIVTLLVFTGGDYNEKVRSWLGSDDPFHLLTLHYYFMEVEPYVISHFQNSLDCMEDFSKRVNTWITSYRRAGIQNMADGLINLHRAEDPTQQHTGFKYFRYGSAIGCSHELQTWFDVADSGNKPEFIEELTHSSFTLSPGIDTLVEGRKIGVGPRYEVIFKETSPFIAESITHEEKIVLDSIADGVNTWSALEKQFSGVVEKIKGQVLHPDERVTGFAKVLISLLCSGMVDFL